MIGYINRVDWDVFPYSFNVDDNECLSDNLGDTDSDLKSTLKFFGKNNVDEIIFAHLNINSIRNEFDLISDMIMGYIDHCVKYAIIQAFSDPYFLVFGQNLRKTVSIWRLLKNVFLLIDHYRRNTQTNQYFKYRLLTYQ